MTTRRLLRAVSLPALAAAVLLTGAGTAAADSNRTTQKPVMLCNLVLLSPGAQVDGSCRAVQLGDQRIVKQDSLSHGLVDALDVLPSGLL
ncbi:hypothetical protein V1J52_01150 [Streptomyces sp. TRM 70351]|uniref:hypothetical protein n=1 Tax=Streptomyces sp. TRM 70351 TaxID=3116552 RepID=UPI002E7C0804|nr:hypothetical protein [Streptomyces sp. TRM 70351]MEE1926800.1 hypothetical protein [Streptomyces sp. TRM 70351]